MEPQRDDSRRTRALPALALALCLGAAARMTWGLPAWAVLAGALSAGVLVWRARSGRLAAIAALALFAFAGALRTAAWLAPGPDSVARLSQRRWVRLHGTIDADPAVRPWGTALTLNVTRADTRRGPERASGRVRLSLMPGGRAWRYGQGIAAEGRLGLPDDAANPGDVPPAQYLRREGIAAVMTPTALRAEGGRGGSRLVALSLAAKAHMERGILQTLPPRQAALLCGLLFSDTGALPEETQRAFARAGTVHILSTSGVHVAILAGLLSVLIPARRPRARKARAALLLALLLFFTLMTGLRPAVARAAVMIAALLAAPLFDREPDAWCALSLAAIALLLWSPGNLLDPGFQLSFAAALSLALWFGLPRVPASTRIGRALHRAGVAISTSVIASLATGPLAARYFGTFSVGAPVSNALVVPAVGPAMALGLVQGTAWERWPALARLAAAANARVLDWILGATHTVARSPAAAWDTGPTADGAVLAFYAAFAAFLLLRLKAQRRGAALAVVPLMAGALAWIAWPPRPMLRVTFLDVGQADCALIQTRGGRAVLIDAGGSEQPGADVGRRVVVPALRRAGVARIDAVVLTHPHEDHAGGLPAVIRAFPVGLWLSGGGRPEGPSVPAALKLAALRGVALRRVRAGDRVALEPGITLEILGPRGAGADANNSSLVCRLSCGRTAVLFAGDAGAEEEAGILAARTDLCANVLKAGHHGSATSGTPAFLRAVQPSDAVISCGRRNRHDFPARTTLERLRAAGARTWRTDVDGGIVAESDGRAVTLRGSRWTWP